MHSTQAAPTPRKPPTALRLFDGFIWLALAALGVLTVAVLIFWVGRSFTDGLYVQGWTNSAVIEHTAPSGELLRQDLDQPLADTASDIRFLSATVQVRAETTAARVVLVTTALAKLALYWFAVLNMHRLARSAMQGQVFTSTNSRRLTRLGWAALAYPVVGWFIGKSVFNSVVSAEDVGVSGFLAAEGVGEPVAWLGVALLLHTIARVFDWGVELQEFEAATI